MGLHPPGNCLLCKIQFLPKIPLLQALITMKNPPKRINPDPPICLFLILSKNKQITGHFDPIRDAKSPFGETDKNEEPLSGL
jgi:hypothetical protein